MKRLIPVLLLLVGGVAHAEEPITGAFGLIFGEALAEHFPLYKEGDGFLIYSYTPELKVKLFTRYRVYVTPVRHLIFGIKAWGKTGGGCSSRYFALKQVLQKKYGAGKANSSDVLTWYWYRRKEGTTEQHISFQCSSDTDNLQLHYLGLHC